MVDILSLEKEFTENLSRTFDIVQKKDLMLWMYKKNISLNFLFGLIYSKEDPKVAFRAAWLFEDIILSDLSKINPFLPEFLSSFPNINNRSVRRHFSKILCILLEINSHPKDEDQPIYLKEIRNTLNAFDFDTIIEFLFDSVIDEKEKVGVKVWNLESLYYLSKRYPWVTDELNPQIDFLITTGSAAILSRGQKLKLLLKDG